MHPSSTTDHTSELLTATELAKAIKVSRRTVGNFTAQKRIPVIRLGGRTTRYHLPRVLEALRKYESEAVG